MDLENFHISGLIFQVRMDFDHDIDLAVVASDVVYDDETFADLLKTLKELSTSRTNIVIAIELRIGERLSSKLRSADLQSFDVIRTLYNCIVFHSPFV